MTTLSSHSGPALLRSRMRAVADFLETSAAQAGDPEHGAGFRGIQQARPQRWQRIVATSLFGAAVRHPAMVGALIRRRLPLGTSYAGGGGHYIVYRRGDTVVKVHKASVAMTESRREWLADRERTRSDLVRRYVGDVAVPQTVEITDHPLGRRRRAVQITAPYVAFDDLHSIFPWGAHRIDAAALDRAKERYPALEQQLRSLVTASLAMVADTGFAPDVASRGNLGIDRADGTSLVLVDLQPILIDGHPIGPATLAQLQDAQRHLAAHAEAHADAV